MPGSGLGYGYSSMHYAPDAYAGQPGQCRAESAYDYQKSFIPPAAAPAPPTYQYQQTSYQASANLPPIQGYYEPIGAPILPPLRINDRISFADDFQRRLQQEQDAAAREQQHNTTTEEKPTGGVSAKLDYDMDRMTDFVTDAVVSIFRSRTQGPPNFRRWVHQVLSATRLPSATILLSLYYLNDRMSRFPDTIPPGENAVYRLLAVALILGSKFLDDNTFINRSWSDVTSIKVTELNTLELTWLELLHWRLHTDPQTPGGLENWVESWKRYDADCIAKTQLPARLSPLDTNVHRHVHNTSGRTDRFSPYPSPYSAPPTRSFEQQPLSSRSTQFSTPYSSAAASDTWGSNARPADDYYKRSSQYDNSYAAAATAATTAGAEEVSRQAPEDRARQSAYQYASSFYPTPSYETGWDAGAWNSVHRYDCHCTACAYQSHYRPYSMTSSYAAQTVMG